MLRLLHLYTFTPPSQFLPLGLVWHGRTPSAYTYGLSLSLLKLHWRSRGQCISLSQHCACICARHTAYRMYAKGGGNVPRTRSVSVSWTWVTALSYQKAARRSLQIYTDEKTGDLAATRKGTDNTNEPFLQSGRAGRSYTKRGRKPSQAELLLREASWRGRIPGMTT